MGLARSAQYFLQSVNKSTDNIELKDISNLKNLAPYLKSIGLNYSTFELKKITPDVNCAIAHHNGAKYINPKYLMSKTSQKKSPANIYKSIKEMFGENMALTILNILQVSESFLLDEYQNDPISVELSNDMLSVLKQLNPMLMPELLGISFFNKLAQTPFGKSFSGRSNKEAHEILFTEVYSHLEKSFKYELVKLSSNGCTFRKHPSKQVQEQLKKEIYYDHVSCSYQKGIGASISILNNLPRSKINEVKCVHLGSPFCEYEVEFAL